MKRTVEVEVDFKSRSFGWIFRSQQAHRDPGLRVALLRTERPDRLATRKGEQASLRARRARPAGTDRPWPGGRARSTKSAPCLPPEGPHVDRQLLQSLARPRSTPRSASARRAAACIMPPPALRPSHAEAECSGAFRSCLSSGIGAALEKRWEDGKVGAYPRRAASGQSGR